MSDSKESSAPVGQERKDTKEIISVGEYRDRILECDERLTNQMRESVQQNANFMSVIVTFVFLFEMNFVAGAFPSELRKIDFVRYSSCLCFLVAANALLVLALSLLLRVTSCLKPKTPSSDSYSLPEELRGDSEELAKRVMTLRYSINADFRKKLEAADGIVFHARRCTLAAMMLGIVSAIMLLVNGRVFDAVYPGLQDNVVATIQPEVWIGYGALSLLGCILAYYHLTAPIRKVVEPGVSAWNGKAEDFEK